MDEKTRQFVLGLTKLTRETGITVTATKYQLHFLPTFEVLNPAELDEQAGYANLNGRLRWVSKNSPWWELYQHNIVR